MATLGDFFEQEEAAMLAKAKAEIAAEAHRYATDPAYRAAVDAKRKAHQDELESLLEAHPEDEEEEDDEEDEE